MSRGVLVREAWPGDTASNMELTRKDKLLRFSPSLEDSSSPRYQYFSKGSRPRSEEAYIDPTSTDYYNYDPFQKPVEDDDDTNSYENVLICKPKRMESGDEGSEDYQNSASIQQWRESKKVMGAREPFIASPGPLLQSRSASTLPAALLGGASTCPEDQRAGHAAPGLGKDSYREPTSDRLPRASLGSGGSRRGPVPRTGDSCVPLPALKTSYYMGVCVLFFRFGF
ncbi:linker for activation of T-cells family member 2 isoform X3 [Bos indicus]|uniref:Linker for activation of T-cells family member 2 isoform X3 n=1 Tax=Bos indicus TaxID=9915 RepID=A0ABM4RKP7_BOSIN